MPDIVIYVLGTLPLIIWLYLLSARGGFWHSGPFLPPVALESASVACNAQIKVVAVIPARNEADVITQSLKSLLQDQHPAPDIILVDDQSTDNTSETAQAYLKTLPAHLAQRVTILQSKDRPSGWTGKLWAVHQGVTHLLAQPTQPDYVLLTDADIHHGPDTIRQLVAKAETDTLHLVSLMVKLTCQSASERLLIPAFVFFFKLLYPFNWVNNAQKKQAGAAGGCMLVRRDSLIAAGGIEAIKGALIDDCTFGKLIKKQGPIWLGLTKTTYSIRPYSSFWEIWHMVRRSAYTQLAYNPFLLLGTMVGMILTYLLPICYILAGIFYHNIFYFSIGLVPYCLMVICFKPTAYLYHLGSWRGLALPLIALLYNLMTLDSARCYYQGRGGEWKGRLQGGIHHD